MDVLIFRLISNKKEEINVEVPYYIKDDTINFKIEDNLYKYNLNNDIIIKNNSNLSITIDFNNDIIYVKLVENDLTFNMPIDKVKITKNDQEITIKYRLLSDEITENEIYLKY